MHLEVRRMNDRTLRLMAYDAEGTATHRLDADVHELPQETALVVLVARYLTFRAQNLPWDDAAPVGALDDV